MRTVLIRTRLRSLQQRHNPRSSLGKIRLLRRACRLRLVLRRPLGHLLGLGSFAQPHELFCHGHGLEVPGEHTCRSQPGVTSTPGTRPEKEPVPGVVGRWSPPTAAQPRDRACAVSLPIAPPSRVPPSPSQTRFAGRSPSRHAFKANRVPSTLTARHRIGHPSPHPARAWWHHPDGMKSGSGRGPP